MIIDRDVVRENRIPFSLLLIQLVLAMLVVFELLAIVGFDFNPATRTFSFGLSTNPLEYLFFMLLVGMLYIVFSKSRRTFESVFVATSMLPFMLKTNFSYKFWVARHEPKAAALVLIQFAFIMAVVLTIYAYLDPELRIVDWQRLGLQGPLTTLLNAAIFLLVVLALYWMYNYTGLYRKATGKK